MPGSRIWHHCDVTMRQRQTYGGLTYRLNCRETCTLTYAEYHFWAIRHSQPVEVDRLVSYPLVSYSSKLVVKEPWYFYFNSLGRKGEVSIPELRAEYESPLHQNRQIVCFG